MSQSVNKKFFYFKLYKPYGYLCQFTGEPDDLLLGDLFDFPKDVYSVGRLDKDSEGLLILTNDNQFKTKILAPSSRKWKTYWVQVEGIIDQESIVSLTNGSIKITHKGMEHTVSKARCKIISSPKVEDRIPPIRFRKNIPTSWIELQISEGKNRQVRKMTSAVGFPTLRLIRYSVDQITLEEMLPKEVLPFTPINL